MKISKILLMALCLFIPFSKSFAQKASIYNYVVTNSGDTIKCELVEGLFGVIKYQPITSTDKYIKVRPKEIKSYYFAKDSSTYEAVKLSDTTDAQYLQRIETGRINLYQIASTYSGTGYGGTSYYTSGAWYVSKDGSPLKEIRSSLTFAGASKQRNQGAFIAMIADDTELLEAFKNEPDFNFKNFRYYLRRYNQNQQNPPVAKSK